MTLLIDKENKDTIINDLILIEFDELFLKQFKPIFGIFYNFSHLSEKLFLKNICFHIKETKIL